MPANYFANPIMFIITAIFSAYIFILMARIILQFSGADSNNPVSLFIIKATRIPLKILSPIFPTVKNINLSALALALVLQVAVGYILYGQQSVTVSGLLIWSIAELIDGFINIYIYSIFITVILSWVNPGTYNPIAGLIYKITEPVVLPFRKLIPLIGGMDLSPMAALLALQVSKMLIIPPLIALI
jgi:YggT family protein